MTVTFTLAVVLGVSLGGAAGAVMRLLLDRYVRYGILVANALGCLVLGFLFGQFSAAPAQPAMPQGGLSPDPALTVLAYGLIGALSTFATVSLRVAQRWVEGRRLQAVWIWLVHVICGFAAAAAGFAVSGLVGS